MFVLKATRQLPAIYNYTAKQLNRQIPTALRKHSASANDLATRNGPIKKLIKVVQMQKKDKMIKIDWNNGKHNRFPFVFLRDNCQCDTCFHALTKQRLCDVIKITQQDLTPTKISVLQSNSQLQITWPDDHISVFNFDWLQDRLISEDIEYLQLASRPLVDGDTVLWGCEMSDSIPSVDFSRIMQEDQGLFDWLNYVRRYGVAVVTNVPKELGQLQLIGEHAGVLKSTLYGPTSIVQSRKNPFNLAFTNLDFGCHTDMSFYEQTGGIEMFHCIAQVNKGGETVLVDGFNIAKQMHDKFNESFVTLRKYLLPFQEENTFKDEFIEFNHYNWTEPFQLDPYGKIKRFCYNDASRDSYLHMPLQEVENFYQAYAKLTSLIRDPTNNVTYKMKAGDVLTANNLRVMHGRKSFEFSDDDKRQLEVGFIDWDVCYSKMRLLANKLGLKVQKNMPYPKFSEKHDR